MLDPADFAGLDPPLKRSRKKKGKKAESVQVVDVGALVAAQDKGEDKEEGPVGADGGADGSNNRGTKSRQKKSKNNHQQRRRRKLKLLRKKHEREQRRKEREEGTLVQDGGEGEGEEVSNWKSKGPNLVVTARTSVMDASPLEEWSRFGLHPRTLQCL